MKTFLIIAIFIIVFAHPARSEEFEVESRVYEFEAIGFPSHSDSSLVIKKLFYGFYELKEDHIKYLKKYFNETGTEKNASFIFNRIPKSARIEHIGSQKYIFISWNRSDSETCRILLKYADLSSLSEKLIVDEVSVMVGCSF